MKAGDEYFQARVDTDEGSVEVVTWVISVVRDRTAYAIQKTPWTWVKRSKTNGDYGWATRIDDCWRRRFRVDHVPGGWALTKAAAYTKALPEVEAAIKKLTKIRAQLTGQRTKARGRTAAKPARATSERSEP